MHGFSLTPRFAVMDTQVPRRYWWLMFFLSIAGLSVGVALSPADWITAVSGLSTVALVGVTTWYVVLTRNLVGAQQATLDQAKASEVARMEREVLRRERLAIVEVWKVCHAFVYSPSLIAKILRGFAESEEYYEDAQFARESLEEICAELQEVSGRLTMQAPDLPGGELHVRTWTLGVSLAQCAGLGLQLVLAYTRAKYSARVEGRVLTSSDVRLQWDDARSAGGSLPDWETLISARAFAEIEPDLERLEEVAFAHLRGSGMAQDGGGA